MTLTDAQLQFLEECEEEFSNRFSDEDPEYKAIFDQGILSPPIEYPWEQQSNYHNRNRPGSSRYQGNSFNDRTRDYRRGNHYKHPQERKDKKFHPY